MILVGTFFFEAATVSFGNKSLATPFNFYIFNIEIINEKTKCFNILINDKFNCLFGAKSMISLLTKPLEWQRFRTVSIKALAFGTSKLISGNKSKILVKPLKFENNINRFFLL